MGYQKEATAGMTTINNPHNFEPGILQVDGDGALIGCAVHTFPVKWRLTEALENLLDGNLERIQDLLGDALREIIIAEMVKAPMPVIKMPKSDQAREEDHRREMAETKE